MYTRVSRMLLLPARSLVLATLSCALSFSHGYAQDNLSMLAYARSDDSLLFKKYARAWAGGTLRRGFLGLSDIAAIAGALKIHGAGYKKHQFDSEILLGSAGELFVLSNFPRISLYQIGNYDRSKNTGAEEQSCILDYVFEDFVRTNFSLEKLSFYDAVRPELEIYIDKQISPKYKVSFDQAISPNFSADFLLRSSKVSECTGSRLLSIFPKL